MTLPTPTTLEQAEAQLAETKRAGQHAYTEYKIINASSKRALDAYLEAHKRIDKLIEIRSYFIKAATEAAPELTQPKPSPSSLVGEAARVILATKVSITPMPDGKAHLGFYASGHQYPDISATKTAENWSKMLNWRVEEFRKAQSVNIYMQIVYTLSDIVYIFRKKLAP